MKRETRKNLAQLFWILFIIMIIQCIGFVCAITELGVFSPRDIISQMSLVLFIDFIASIIGVILFCLNAYISSLLFKVIDFLKKNVKILRRHSEKGDLNKFFCPKCGTEIISGDTFCFKCRKSAGVTREEIYKKYYYFIKKGP